VRKTGRRSPGARPEPPSRFLESWSASRSGIRLPRVVPSLARLGFVLLLGCAIQAACGGDDDDGSPPLEQTEWTLVGGVEAPPDAVPTLTLEEGTASGFAGCNRFTGGYELDGNSFAVGPLAATQMACENAKTAVEAAYLPALEAVDAWAIEGGELVLSADGKETLRYEGG
jgi:heat shock protein HslJ